jgi:glutaconate CoA-transferase subunit A
MPVRGVIATDYQRVRPDFRVIKNPYGEDEIMVVPALSPDVSLIHAFRADSCGNCILNSTTDDALLARASEKVIVSAEEVVATKELKASQRGYFLSRVHVSAVVPLPKGAAPTGCGSLYGADSAFLMHYLKAAGDAASFPGYLRHFCAGLAKGGAVS